ncbi:MAG: TonB-dependent receptor [Arachidicoccus sp.]|nr:TonB-dependent receptor [Arachidicoccus sp.]
MNKNIFFFCLSPLLSVFLSSQIHAQSDSSVTKDLGEIVVMSEKLQIPFSKQNRNIEVITAAQIKALPVNSLNQVLSYISGIDVRQRGPNGTQADIGIDGGTFDQTLILVNGIKMSDPQTGHNQSVIPIPLDAIERIEVLKGAAAGIYGVNAMMGVINIVTKQSNNTGLYVKGYGGSSFLHDDSTNNLYTNFGAEAVAQIHSDKWNHTFAGSYDKGNGYRYNTAYRNSKILYSSEATLNKNTNLQLLGGFSENAYGANNFYSAPGDVNAQETVRNITLSAKMSIKAKENWTIKPYFNYRHGYDNYIYVKQNPSIYENIHNSNVYDFGADNIIYNNWGNLLAGINIRDESIRSTNLGNRNRTNYGGFLGYQYSLQNKLNVNADVFFNQNSAFGFNAYPSIDIGYNLNNYWRIYANAGMGQRLPTFTDLYYSDPGNIGNPNLKPEHMTSYELGFKYNKHETFINTSAFYRNGKDFIDWVRTDTTQPWQVENFTTLKTFGANFNISNTWEINKDFNLNAYTGYTYLKPTIGKALNGDEKNYISKYAVNCLQHQWIVRLAATFYNHIEMSLNNKLLKRYNAGNPIDGYNLKQYNLTDIRLGYTKSCFDVSFDINNLWNIKYIENGVIPLPGRWCTLSAGIRI